MAIACHAMLLCFKRIHINRKAILYIRTGQCIVSLVNLLDWNDFYVSGDVIFAAKVKHLLRFGNTPDVRTREAATLENNAKCRYGMRLVWCANTGHVAI